MTARFPSLQPVEVRKQDIAPGYLPQWILASSACFPMFPMCEIDGQNYLDGAYSDNLPSARHFGSARIASSPSVSSRRHRRKNTQITRS